MRTLTKLILAAASLALVLGVAGQASATSSISLVLLTGGTGTGSSCDGFDHGCVDANVSDELTFAITMSIDTLGMAGYNFDLRWDTDLENELDLIRFRLHNPLSIGPAAAPPLFAGYTVIGPASTQESIDGKAGNILGMVALAQDLATPAFASDVSFRVGVVRFHVTGNLNNNSSMQIGFFTNPSINGFGIADVPNQITPDFGFFEVASVPEPGTSLLMGMGVLGLIMAGRASRKS